MRPRARRSRPSGRYEELSGIGRAQPPPSARARALRYADPTIDRFFATLDANFEFGEGVRADADAVFERIDGDGDGAISNDELRAHFRDRGYTDVAIDRIFATLDVDLDGEISRDELCDAFVKYSALRFASGGSS